jgi:hypothetical protein
MIFIRQTLVLRPVTRMIVPLVHHLKRIPLYLIGKLPLHNIMVRRLHLRQRRSMTRLVAFLLRMCLRLLRWIKFLGLPMSM